MKVSCRFHKHSELKYLRARIEELEAALFQNTAGKTLAQPPQNLFDALGMINALPPQTPAKNLLRLALQEALKISHSPIGAFHRLALSDHTQACASCLRAVLPMKEDAQFQDCKDPFLNTPSWKTCLEKGKPHFCEYLEASSEDLLYELLVPVSENNRVVAILALGNRSTKYTEEEAQELLLLTRNTWNLLARKEAEESLGESQRAREEQSRLEALRLNEVNHELGEREEHLRAIFEAAQDSIFIKDRSLRYTAINPAMQRLLNQPVERLISKTDSDLFEPEEAAHNRRVDRTVLQGIIVNEENTKTIAKKKHTFHTIKAPLYNKQGAIAGLCGIARDITLRKHSEEALRASRKRLKAVIESMPILLDAFDENNRIIYWNKECERVTGYSRQEVLDSPDMMFKLYPDPKERARVFKVIEEHGGVFHNIDFELTRKDGEKRIVSWSNLSGEKPIAGWEIWAIGVDVTERRKIERALEKESRFNATVVDTIQSLLIVLDLDGRIQGFNRACEVCSGYSAEEVKGKEIFSLLLAPKEGEAVKKVFRSLKKGLLPSEFTNYWITKTGEERLIEWRNAVVRDSLGRVEFILGTGQDITERKRKEAEHEHLELQLQQAQKMEAIGTLAGGIAHDFNNILSVILGYVDLAVEDLEEENSSRQYLEEVLIAAKRAQELVGQILAFSRQGDQRRKAVFLQDIIQETLKLLRGSFPASIEISTQIDSSASPTMADATQLHQLLMNLCTNAYHAIKEMMDSTPEENHAHRLSITLREISISAEEAKSFLDLSPANYLELAITDTGHGMDERTCQRIFDPYFTTKKPGEGTGLGLAMAHSIVKACGGTILVSSELNKGSTFLIFLPTCAQAVKNKAQSVTKKTEQHGTQHILLVDDEPSIRSIGKLALERLGYQVTTSENGAEAFALFQAQPDYYDIVVTDLTMPKMSGIELIENLHTARPNLPVILCTGYSENLQTENIEEIGAKSLLIKPFMAYDLSYEIQRIMAQAAKTEEAQSAP